jgi:hypothetical protein
MAVTIIRSLEPVEERGAGGSTSSPRAVSATLSHEILAWMISRVTRHGRLSGEGRNPEKRGVDPGLRWVADWVPGQLRDTSLDDFPRRPHDRLSGEGRNPEKRGLDPGLRRGDGLGTEPGTSY